VLMMSLLQMLAQRYNMKDYAGVLLLTLHQPGPHFWTSAELMFLSLRLVRRTVNIDLCSSRAPFVGLLIDSCRCEVCQTEALFQFMKLTTRTVIVCRMFVIMSA